MIENKPNLEERINEEHSQDHFSQNTYFSSIYNNLTTNLRKHRDEIKNYFIDITASITFYTPIMAPMEYFIADMSGEEVLKSRSSAIGIAFLAARPNGIFRDWWARKLNATPESSRIKKILVDASALVVFQIPTYTTILTLSGASLSEIIVALPMGIAIGATFGRPYGYYLDKWRKLWGGKPTLEK